MPVIFTSIKMPCLPLRLAYILAGPAWHILNLQLSSIKCCGWAEMDGGYLRNTNNYEPACHLPALAFGGQVYESKGAGSGVLSTYRPACLPLCWLARWQAGSPALRCAPSGLAVRGCMLTSFNKVYKGLANINKLITFTATKPNFKSNMATPLTRLGGVMKV